MLSKYLSEGVSPREIAAGKVLLYANHNGNLIPLLPQTNNLSATLSIDINNFRPCLLVTVVKPSHEASIPVRSNALGSPSSSIVQHKIATKMAERIELVFAHGCRLSSKKLRRMQKQSLEQDEEVAETLDDLPEGVRKMLDPMRIDITHIYANTISTNIDLQCPDWAQKLKAHLAIEDAMITLLVDDTSPKLWAIEKMQNILYSLPDPVLRFHHQNIANSNYIVNFTQESIKGTVFQADPLPQKPIGYKASCAFRDSREYMTAVMAGATIDQDESKAKREAYEAKTKTLLLVDGPIRNGVQCFYGFIDPPKWGEGRLRTDDKMEIGFKVPKNASKIPTWEGIVIDHHKVHCRGSLPLLVVPVGFKPDKPGSFKPSFITRSTSNSEDFNSLLRREKGNPVQVTIIVNELTFSRIGWAYQKLYGVYQGSPYRDLCGDSDKNESKTYHSRILRIFSGRRADQWPVMDLYSPIIFHTPLNLTPRSMNTLNEDQQKAIYAARKLRGGIQLIQGPPGTGKTHLIASLCQPFFAAQLKVIVLVIAPTNRGADDLAHDLQRELRLSKEHGYHHAKGRYILRIHVESSEEAIFYTQSGLTVQSTEARDNDVDHAYKYRGVRDKRIQDVSYSIGYMMLMVSGIVQDDEYTDPVETRYACFRRLYQKMKGGEKFSSEESENFYQTKQKLRIRVIEEASAIIGTTTGVLATYVMNHIQGKVGAVFMDEAAYEREDHLAPLFAADLRLDPCFVVVGDHQQLRPLVKSREEDNEFRSQLEISFMARMIGIGLDYTMLTEQHRMVEDIAKIPNALTYGGKLTNADITALSRRENATKFRVLAKDLFDKGCNALIYHLPRSKDNIGRRKNGDRSGGKANQFYVCVVAKLLCCIRTAMGTEVTIAVLTPYLFQKSFYSKMLGSMRKEGVPGVENITVETFDAAQGREFDIVIADLPMDHSIGFLSDRNRLNVAMTRARDGLIILCDRDHIKSSTQDAEYLQGLVRLLRDSTFEAPKRDNYPDTPYFEPTEY